MGAESPFHHPQGEGCAGMLLAILLFVALIFGLLQLRAHDAKQDCRNQAKTTTELARC